MTRKRVAFGVGVLITVLLVTPFMGTLPAAIGQAEPAPEFDFTHYEENPILSPGAEGEWDAGYVFASRVSFHNDTFHMFYIGGEQPIELRPWHVGYASSTDGFNWTKSELNPVLQVDSALAPYGVSAVVPIITTVDATPVFPLGAGREWDRDALSVDSIVETDAGYALYFTATGGIFFGIGRVISTDGITWQKYDDPTTEKAMFAVSDPVFWFSGFSDAWNQLLVSFPSVLPTENGWEMFYFGVPFAQMGDEGALGGLAWSVLHTSHFPIDPFTPNYGVGYAVSEDGVTWMEVGDGPVLTAPATFTGDDPGWMPWAPNVIVVDDTYYVYYSMWDFENELNFNIGVATGTAGR
ncbi:MAG: hypothetical protein GYB65_21755 [Chloroflexi bacterium]|nr:hypothetical protein [Chloroflexota bacterium]